MVFARVDKDKSGGLSRDEMRDYYKDTAQAGQEYVKQRREQAKKAGPFGGKPKGPPDPDREIGFGVCIVNCSASVYLREQRLSLKY